MTINTPYLFPDNDYIQVQVGIKIDGNYWIHDDGDAAARLFFMGWTDNRQHERVKKAALLFDIQSEGDLLMIENPEEIGMLGSCRILAKAQQWVASPDANDGPIRVP